MKRCAAGLYVAACELLEAVGNGDKKKVSNAQRKLRREADKFAASYADGADDRLREDERRGH